MRVVLDTNVLISSLIGDGKPRRLLKMIITQSHSLITSEHIVAEFSRVCADEKIRRYVEDEEVASFLGAFLTRAVFVRPGPSAKVFGNPDDIVLATAKDGCADFIVTGDKHMLELHRFGQVRIVTVEEALSMLKRKREVQRRRRNLGRESKEV